MPRLPVLATLTVGAALAAGAAAAQPRPDQPSRRPPVEIGAGLGGFAIRDIDFLEPQRFAPAADIRVTVPLTRRFSIESAMSIRRQSNPFERRTKGLYSIQIKQRLMRAGDGRTSVFLSYGGVGSFAHVSSPFFEAYNEVEPPVYPIVGVGVQQELARRLAVRADAQMLSVGRPLGVRLAGGVSIPFGGYGVD